MVLANGIAKHMAYVKIIPNDIDEISFKLEEASIPLPNLLKDAGMTESTSEATRMIKQGAVRVDDIKVIDPRHSITRGTTSIYQVGKRKFKKIIL